MDAYNNVNQQQQEIDWGGDDEGGEIMHSPIPPSTSG
jgi:hypothetical protein